MICFWKHHWQMLHLTYIDLWQANGVEKMDAVLKSPHDAKLNPNFGQKVAGKDGPNCTPKSLPHKEWPQNWMVLRENPQDTMFLSSKFFQFSEVTSEKKIPEIFSQFVALSLGLCQSHSSHLPETLGEQQEEQHDLRWGALPLSLLSFLAETSPDSGLEKSRQC